MDAKRDVSALAESPIAVATNCEETTFEALRPEWKSSNLQEATTKSPHKRSRNAIETNNVE